MTALPVSDASRNDARALSLLPGLSAAAARALDVSPAEIVARWIQSVSEDARRAYRRSLATFTAWALPGATDPQAGLQLLCEAGAGGAHELLSSWRDHLRPHAHQRTTLQQADPMNPDNHQGREHPCAPMRDAVNMARRGATGFDSRRLQICCSAGAERHAAASIGAEFGATRGATSCATSGAPSALPQNDAPTDMIPGPELRR